MRGDEVGDEGDEGGVRGDEVGDEGDEGGGGVMRWVMRVMRWCMSHK